MKKVTLTKLQKDVLDFVKNYISENNEAPLVNEIKDNFKFSSLRSVTQIFESLEKKGFIKRDSFKHRGISILNNDPQSIPGTIQVPLIASAGCDTAKVYADGRYDEFVTVDKKLVEGHHDIVAIRALGNSMLDAGINNNDLVLVEVTENVESGDRVVAILGDMAVIKKLRKTQSAFILEPESKNKEYSSIIMSEENSKIFGKVLSVIPMSEDEDDYQFIYENNL